MMDRLRLFHRRSSAALAAVALLATVGVPLAAPAAKKPGPTVAERLARTAADIDAVLYALAAAFPDSATRTDQADEQAHLAVSYLTTARQSIKDIGPSLDPKFDAIPLRAASNPLADAAKTVDEMTVDAENAPNEPWALKVISIQQNLHTAQGFIESGHLLGTTASPLPGDRKGHGER